MPGCGLLVYQIFVGNSQKQFKRRLYITVYDGEVDEYIGVQNDMEVNDPVTDENVSLKGMAHSEDERMKFMMGMSFEGKTITIPIENEEYKVVGILIEYNSFTRHLTLTPNDLAYTCDIEALDKKITALAEQSHLNDAAMASIQEEYATVNEVNEVLANNYVLKSDYYTKSECDNKYAKYFDVCNDYYVKIEIDNKFDEYYDWNYCDENFVSKSEFEELKKENASLKATIAAFETRFFYHSQLFLKNFLRVPGWGSVAPHSLAYTTL